MYNLKLLVSAQEQFVGIKFSIVAMQTKNEKQFFGFRTKLFSELSIQHRKFVASHLYMIFINSHITTNLTQLSTSLWTLPT